MIRTRPRRRVVAAWACLLALVGSALALPALHAAVHAGERAARAPRPAPAPRPQLTVHRHGHCHGGVCHDDGPEDGPPAERAAREPATGNQPARPHHHHDGDREGEHGTRSPEHLAALLLPSRVPLVTPPWRTHVTTTVEARPREVTRVLEPRPAIRAPPVVDRA